MQKILPTFLILLVAYSGFSQVDSALTSEEPVFSHQYKYLEDDKYQFVDTSFNSLKWYHQLNNTLSDDFGYVVLTNMGGPRNQIVVPEARDFWQYQSFGPYNGHFTMKERVPFYYTRSPLTEAKFISGYNRGQTFMIYHTQNVHKRWNFHIRYKRLNSLGFYTNNQNRQSSFMANTAYESPSGSYKVKAYVLSELMEIQEFGGIENDSAFLANEQDSRELIQVNLRSDDRVLRNREVWLKQDIRLTDFKKNVPEDSTTNALSVGKSFLGFGHEFKYTRRSQVYQGASTGFYDNYYFTPEGAQYTDSMAYHGLDNYLYTRTQIGDTNRFNLEAGIRNLTYRYLNNSFNFSNSSWGMSGNISGRLANLVEVTGQLDYALTGALANTFSAEAQGRVQIAKWLSGKAGYHYSLRYPELYEQFYFSNNFIWQNNFDPYSLGILSYGVSWPWNGELMIRNFNATKYIIFNENGEPSVAPGTIKYTQFKLKQDLTFWDFLHLDNRLVYQNDATGGEYLPLPEWVTRNSLYVRFRMFDKTLQCLVGGELEYFSRFNSQRYNPALGRFHLSGNARSIGNYPYLNLFAQFKVRKAKIFLKYQHANQGLNGYDYFAAPNYPLNDRVFRFGIYWRFFN